MKSIQSTQTLFPYEGDYKSMRIKVLGETPEGYQTRIIKDEITDTLYYWYKPKFEVDTTFFIVSNEKYVDTFKHRFRTIKADSLKMKNLTSGTLSFDQDFTMEANIPLTKIDTTDFYDGINKDTLTYSVRTKLKSEYGNIRVNLRNAKFPLIVQLVNEKGVVLYERYTTESPVVDFNNLSPRTYALRVIYDTNGNGKYDTGNFLLGIQPERVSYSQPIDEVRSNFDWIIEFPLLD